MVVLLVIIPTLSTWDGFDKVGITYHAARPRIDAKEYAAIKTALKRNTVKQVAIDFNRSWGTIYKIAKETK